MRYTPEPPGKRAIIIPKVLLEQSQNGSSLLDTFAGLVNGLGAILALPAAELVDRRLELPGHHAGELSGYRFPTSQLKWHVLVPRWFEPAYKRLLCP
jgi:hypothetical protein